MSQTSAPDPETSGRLPDGPADLEARIARIEAHLGLAPLEVSTHPATGVTASAPGPAAPSTSFEQQVGEYGLGWLGSAIGLLGLIFAVSHLFGTGSAMLAATLGYGAAVGLYLGHRLLLRSYPATAQLLIYDSGLLLYFTTVRLHFFTPAPLLGSLILAVAVLVVVQGFLLFQAVRRSAPLIGGIALTLGLLTALFADSVHPTLLLILLNSAAAVYLARRRGWWNVLLVQVPLSYLALLTWLAGNPLLGHPLDPVRSGAVTLLYILALVAVYTWPTFFFKRESSREMRAISLVLFNLFGGIVLLALCAAGHFAAGYETVFASAAALLLGLASGQWIRTRTHLAPGLYAATGFLALSVAIFGATGLPWAYLWLSLQSLLVDVAGQSPGLRIVAFLGLGLVTVLISVFYTRLRRFLTDVRT